MLKLSIASIAIFLLLSGYSNNNLELTHILEKKEAIYSIKQAKI
jgi:hypothetical protein